MKCEISGEEQMRELGMRLGHVLVGGECIQLVGDIGAGKTTLTKGIARGMGIEETVQSPTFTINRTYDSPKGLRLSHYDFYRLAEPGIMSDELAESLDDPSTVVILEWGSIVDDVVPVEHLRILFESPSETTRVLTFEARGAAAEALVGAVA